MTSEPVAPAPRTIGPLGVADFVRYSGASGDFNPLHYDEARARAAGFDSVFAQGMFGRPARLLRRRLARARRSPSLPGALRRRRLVR